MQDCWFSLDKIAEHLGVSKNPVRARVCSRGTPGHNVGRLWKFKTDEVDKWVRSGGATSEACSS